MTSPGEQGSVCAHTRCELFNVRVGGLRGGWAQASLAQDVDLHDFSYVPGVTVSGAYDSRGDVLTVGGPAAAHGVLHVSSRGQLTGTLDGQPVKVSPGTAIVARAAAAPPLR